LTKEDLKELYFNSIDLITADGTDQQKLDIFVYIVASYDSDKDNLTEEEFELVQVLANNWGIEIDDHFE